MVENITYTISALIHVPFPQHALSDLVTPLAINQYTKKVQIGDEYLTVSFYNSASSLPSGMYPRRLFSYLSKALISTRNKTSKIKLPRSKSQFFKEILKINYGCSKKETEAINAQLKSFVNCSLTISYSNPNDASRKPYTSILFVKDDCSFLYDDNQAWQQSITLSDEMVDLIKSTSVPISEYAVNTFTSARKLDVYNYLSYQNYNLYQKNLNHVFHEDDLLNLFGGAITHRPQFRRVFKKILVDLREISSLEITKKGRYSYVLISNEASLLKKKERRKTNVKVADNLIITEDCKLKIEKQTNSTTLDVESACLYISKKLERGGTPIRNQYAYLRDLLKNPSYFYKEKQTIINLTHELQFKQYEELPNQVRKQWFDLLVHSLKITRINSVPLEQQLVLEQLKTPGRVIIKDTPSFKYLCYLFWACKSGQRIDVADGSNHGLFLNLFKSLG